MDVEVDAPTEGYQQQLSDKGWMDKSENEESIDEALKIELMEQEILEQVLTVGTTKLNRFCLYTVYLVIFTLV